MFSPAQNLPFHVLVEVIAASEDHDDVPDHGGRHGWNSAESIRSMPLVCRSWADAANHVLYSSVALFGGETAALFVRTLSERPRLGWLVKALVISLRCEEESSDVEGTQEAESGLLVEALRPCVDLRHLQIRPLYHSVRPSLLAAIVTKPLVSLLCGPRAAGSSDVRWGQGLFVEKDLAVLATPRLRTLDVDFQSPTPLLPRSLAAIRLPALSLVTLRVTGVSDALLLLLLSAVGPTLETLDVYLESILHPFHAIEALIPSAPHLRSISWANNPADADPALALSTYPSSKNLPTPVFDVLLPHFPHLEELFVTATEISPRIFALLGPSVHSVEVQSLNDGTQFFCCPGLLDDLANPWMSRGLKKLVIRDRDEQWERSSGVVAAVCRARGIEFVFVPDHEVYSDEGEDWMEE